MTLSKFKKISKIINFSSYIGMGILLGAIGFTAFTWQFWAIFVVAAVMDLSSYASA